MMGARNRFSRKLHLSRRTKLECLIENLADIGRVSFREKFK